MVELWVISRTEGDNVWTTPVYVKWIMGVARFYPACPLREPHYKVFEKFINQSADYRPCDGTWEVPRSVFHNYARKIEEGSDPKHYVQFGTAAKVADKAEKASEDEYHPGARDEFILAMVAKGMAPDYDTALQWWTAFCQHGADWLINREKPIDMYFIRLHISPYRQNWMLEMLKRFPKLGQMLQTCEPADQEILLHKLGFYEALLNHEMLAMPTGGQHCYRHIEVEHRRRWWKESVRVERVRLAQLGPVKYAAYFMDSVRRRIKISAKLYRQWFAAVARPQAAVMRGDALGRPRLVPASRISPHYFRPARFAELPPVVALDLPKWGTNGVTKALPAPNGSVPALPDIQPPAKDVRNGTDAGVQRSVNGNEPERRVPLLLAGEKYDTNNLLGPGSGAGDGSGLAT